jgi:hypothetical protein
MDALDLKLKLFAGRPIYADGYGNIPPLTVKEVIDIGYTEYLKYLNVLTLEASDFLDENDNNIHILELFLINGGEDIKNIFEEALSFFLKGSVLFDEEYLRILVKVSDNEINIVDKSNYHKIQDVIKWQNYINSFEEKELDDFNPVDEDTKKLKERMDLIAKKRDEIKNKHKNNHESDEDNEELDFYDILSSIASKSYGINEINILDLTVYQVYRKFKRLEIIDQYDVSIKSILAGAKDVKINHWSSKD